MVGQRDHRTAVIHIVCDFGTAGPYLGEMRTAIFRTAPQVHAEFLMSDMPAFDPKASSYLLAALAGRFEAGDVCLAIVDPGVGTERAPLIVSADGVWFVGPDNGLFEVLIRRSRSWQSHEIVWQPPAISSSFHGRDLFAPVAARLASRMSVERAPRAAARFPDWPDDWQAVIYADGYGNLVSGQRARTLDTTATLAVAGQRIVHARTFGEVADGALFWYENSMGLIEIAANRRRASDRLGFRGGRSLAYAIADRLHGPEGLTI